MPPENVILLMGFPHPVFPGLIESAIFWKNIGELRTVVNYNGDYPDLCPERNENLRTYKTIPLLY